MRSCIVDGTVAGEGGRGGKGGWGAGGYLLHTYPRSLLPLGDEEQEGGAGAALVGGWSGRVEEDTMHADILHRDINRSPQQNLGSPWHMHAMSVLTPAKTTL